MESQYSKITSSNSRIPVEIEDSIALEIERLCAHTRELIALAMEIKELHQEVTELISVALQYSRQAVDLKRKSRRMKARYSHLLN